MLSGASVLVIDDDSAILELVAGILEHAGCTTTVAQNAFHGLKLAREVRPSVIVCDMMMPDMAGSDVFRALAAQPATARIPRIMISGHPGADCSCANAFLPKPFAAEEMLTTLENALATPAVLRGAALREAQWRG